MIGISPSHMHRDDQHGTLFEDEALTINSLTLSEIRYPSFDAPINSPTLSFHESSLTADTLKISIEEIGLELLDKCAEEDVYGFFALTQNIFQYSNKERENIYRCLQLNSTDQEKLEQLHAIDQQAFQNALKMHIESFFTQLMTTIPNFENDVLLHITDRLELNLILLKKEEDQIKIVKDNFSTASASVFDHACFKSEICVALAAEKKLFQKSDLWTIHIACDSQSSLKMREILLEFELIRKTIIAAAQDEHALLSLNQESYFEWYQNFLLEGKLDYQSALSSLYEAEIQLRDFFENYFDEELRKYPLVIITVSPATQKGTACSYQAVNLKKLKETVLEIDRKLELSDALEKILEFIEYETLDEELFEAIYQDSYSEMFDHYQSSLNTIVQELQIKDYLCLYEEDITEKIDLLISNLNGAFTQHITSASFSPPTHFKQLKAIRHFLEKKRFIDQIAHQIAGKQSSDLKALLRQSQKIQDFWQTDKVAKQIQGAKTQEEINKILFKHVYDEDWDVELAKHHTYLQEIDLQGSLDDEKMLDEIDEMQFLKEEEEGVETPTFHQKSLDELCQEYVQINHLNASAGNAIKLKIQKIHSSIEDLKGGQTLPIDHDQQYPIHLIAEVCLKFETIFGVTLRNTQLLAIFSALESTNGSLSEVKTGEGKSFIIAALAIIKHKQGHEVDVITSSPTLAKRDLQKFQAFYSDQFQISSSHNCCEEGGMMAKSCYQPRSIVYGTASTFEGDSLRAEFYQAETFNGRERGIAILDEADSALLDKSSWLCQISDSVAGMSTVKPFLFYIWALILKKISELGDKQLTQDEYKDFVQKIKEEIVAEKEGFFPQVESFGGALEHLQPFIAYRISHWVDSAFKAISYTDNKEYSASQVQHKIIPIDYANTGEWEIDVQWEDGLHQFLQMRHGLEAETETLTKSFMSNFTLTRKYQSVFGLSGTLGGIEEATTLHHLYGIETRKIPPFKTNRLQEREAWLSNTQENWLDSLYADVVLDGMQIEAPPEDALPLSSTHRNRASLIICHTVADVELIAKHFKKNGISPSDIVTYTRGDDHESIIGEATQGKIIIATNLAGRGTDIEASSIEEAGGLHVILSFLPSNRRIQDQAFGRTARKGLSGSARLIIQSEELKEYHIETSKIALLDLVNDPRNSNLKGLKVKYDDSFWEVHVDEIHPSKRCLIIQEVNNTSITRTIDLSYSSHIDRSKSYNTILMDGHSLPPSKTLSGYFTALTYDSIMHGRNQLEQERLKFLASSEKDSLLTKQSLFESFQSLVHQVPYSFHVDEKFNPIRSYLLELYKSYLLDEWAIFLDQVNKKIKEPSIQAFSYAKNLFEMTERNDLYKMQFINTAIDIERQDIYDEADYFYEIRGQKNDITAGFACYNRVFVALKKDKTNGSLAKDYLNQALAIFKKAETYEKWLLSVRRKLTSSLETQASQEKEEEMSGTQMLRMILTMQSLIKRNLEELEQLTNDYNRLIVSFSNPAVLKEQSGNSQTKEEGDEKGYAISESLMQESIRLGLKGVLDFKGEGSAWLAILLAIVSVIVAIASIAAIICSGGAFAPLITVLASAALGASMNGAICAIKGAIKGDFSLNQFGKDVLTGLVTGAVGGGIGTGLAVVAAKFLQTAVVLTRVVANAGIGALAGAGGNAAGYAVGEALHGRKITGDGFGKAILHGAVGGVIVGGLAGIARPGINNIAREAMTGVFGGAVSNAAKQGIQLAMGEKEQFDGLELVENALAAGAGAGLHAKVKKYAAHRQQQRQKSLSLASASKPKDNPQTGVNERRIRIIEERIAGGIDPINERPLALKTLNKLLAEKGLPPKTIEDFGDLSEVNARYRAGNQTRPILRNAGINSKPTAHNEIQLKRAFRTHDFKRNEKVFNTLQHVNHRRRGSFDDSGRMNTKLPRSPLEYLDLESARKRQTQENLRLFNRLKQPLVFRNQLAKEFSNLEGFTSHSRMRRGSLSELPKPIIFEKGKGWTNARPKTNGKKTVTPSPASNPPNGKLFNSAAEARTQALERIGVIKKLSWASKIIDDKGFEVFSINEGGEIVNSKGNVIYGNKGEINTTEIYVINKKYEYIDKASAGYPKVSTRFIALQHHPMGHPENNIHKPHYHIRPAYLPGGIEPKSKEQTVFHIDGNNCLPKFYTKIPDGESGEFDFEEHFFY